MTGHELLYIVLLIVCVGLTAFFCTSETAFLSLQKVRLEHMVSTGVKGAKRVSRMIERPEKLLAVVLLGINLANTAAAALGTMLAVSIWGEQGIIYATIGMTIIILIFAETTPKTFAAQHAERMAILYARPLGLVAWLLTPFVTALSWISAGFAKIIGGAPIPKSLASAEEIRTMKPNYCIRSLSSATGPSTRLWCRAWRLSLSSRAPNYQICWASTPRSQCPGSP